MDPLSTCLLSSFYDTDLNQNWRNGVLGPRSNHKTPPPPPGFALSSTTNFIVPALKGSVSAFIFPFLSTKPLHNSENAHCDQNIIQDYPSL